MKVRANQTTGQVLTVGHGRHDDDIADIVTYEGDIPEVDDIEYLFFNGLKVIILADAEIEQTKAKKDKRLKDKDLALSVLLANDVDQFVEDTFTSLKKVERAAMADIIRIII